MSIAFTKTSTGQISAFCKGRSFVVSSDHAFYDKVIEALKSGNEDDFCRYADLKTEVHNVVQNLSTDPSDVVKIIGDTVYFNDLVINNTITERIISFIKDFK
jgi:hypothetical protein